MAKRFMDITVALAGLVLSGPVILPLLLVIFLQDRKSPFYKADRVAMGGGTFRMFKLRSMVVNAASIGGPSTSADDRRITAVGRFIRRLKLDELPQLWNVLRGDMSLVGPRPQVPSEAVLYTDAERHLFDVRPGITDFSSIVFADEGDILRGHPDADEAYNHLIRPWKSRLSLFYARHRNMAVDVRLILLTLLNGASRARALRGVQRILRNLRASERLVTVAGRSIPLQAAAPPMCDPSSGIANLD